MLRIFHNDKRGASMIETTIALLIMIPMIFWVFEFAMYCYTTEVMQYAARQGVQYASTHGTDAPNCSGPGGNVNSSCPDTAGNNVTALVAKISQNSGHPISGSQVLVSWPSNNNNPASQVTVTISTPYTPFVRLPFIPPNIVGTATGQIIH